LGLHGERHLADLVEQQRSAVRELELALAGRDGAGEGATLVAEQFRLEQGLRDRGAVDADEWPVAARTRVVDGAGDDLLARSALALQEHGAARISDHGDLLAQLLDRRVASEQPMGLVAGGHGRAQRPVLGAQLLELEGAVQDMVQLVQPEGLRQVVDGAATGRFHRLRDGAERGHHHDERTVVQLRVDVFQQLKAAAAGHLDVGKDQVEALLLQFGQGRGAIVGRPHLEAAAERGAQEVPHRLFVVDYQQVALVRHRCAFPP
jgi:hypothetical protein